MGGVTWHLIWPILGAIRYGLWHLWHLSLGSTKHQCQSPPTTPLKPDLEPPRNISLIEECTL